MEKDSDGNADISAEVLKQSVAAAACGFVVTDYQQKDNPVVFVNQAFKRMKWLQRRGDLGEKLPLSAGE